MEEGPESFYLFDEEERDCFHNLLKDEHPITFSTRTDGYRQLPWLFWKEPSTSPPRCFDIQSPNRVTAHDIRDAIQSLNLHVWYACTLVQFWAPIWIEDQCFLRTLDQPFAMPYLRRQLCSLRKQCVGLTLRADGEEAGVLGRVFRNRRSESTPNVDFYMDADYPPRRLALSCKMASHLAVPVWESSTQNCVGVLEFLNYPIGQLYGFGGPLEVVGLKVGLPYNCEFAAAEHSPIRETLEKMKEIRKVCLTQAWVACRDCGVGNICLVVSSDIFNGHDKVLDDFSRGCRMYPLQKGQGLVGKAYLSRKPYFCRDITTQFTSGEYPLVYYGCHARLAQSFAICLHHTCSDNYYIVELFFANGDCGDPHYILGSVMTILQEFPKLEVASGEESTGGLHVEVIQPSTQPCQTMVEVVQPPMQMCQTMVGSTGNGGDNSIPGTSHPLMQMCQTMVGSTGNGGDNSIPGTSHHRAMVEMEYTSSGNRDVAVVTHAKKSSNTVLSTSYPQETRSTEIITPLETLRQHFGRPRDDAAASIGVSPSTLKRDLRKHGIKRWPGHKRHRPNPEQDVPPRSHLVSHHGQPEATIVTATQNANTMTVIAKYRKEYLRFGLPFSSGMVELMEQLSKRVESNTATYKIHYTDEHRHRFKIACDEDLKEYINTCRSQGKTTMDILVGH